MIKNIYGYVYDYVTGVMTSYPNSIIELHSNDANEIPRYYMVSTKVYDTGRFEVEGVEGAVHRSAANLNIYTVWFNKPSPILAKSQFFNQIYTDAEVEVTRLTKELEKAKKHTKEVMDKFANYKES